MFEGVRQEMELIGLYDWEKEPCLTELEVAVYEAAQGFRLPEEYREFVKTMGNGFEFWHWPLRVFGLPLPIDRSKRFVPSAEMVVLACTDFGEVLCMDRSTGKTYAWSRYWAEIHGPKEPCPCGFEEWLDRYATIFNRME